MDSDILRPLQSRWQSLIKIMQTISLEHSEWTVPNTNLRKLYMLMSQHLSDCKRKARQLKSDHPDLSFVNRLDIAAREQGFKHYTSIVNLLKLLGNDKAPTEIAIVMAGGNAADCPYRTIMLVTRAPWPNTKNH